MSKIIGFNGAESTRELAEGDCELAVAGLEGDVKHIWNPRNAEEVSHARETYNKFIAKGYKAYRVNADGTEGEQMNGFDAEAGKIILMPQMAGG